IDAALAADGAIAIAHGNNAEAALAQFVTDHRADVAETLHHGGGRAGLDLQFVQGFEDAIGNAAPRGLAAADATAQFDRLACDDLRTGIADLHAVGVHDPGHGLLVGAQVGGHHVHARADDDQDLFGEAARQPLQLAAREPGRVASDAALGAAE